MSATSDLLRKVRRVLVSAVLVSLWWAPASASANANLYWEGGGYMQNYVIDLILYGNNFTAEDYDNARDYVTYFANYVNGQYNPAGKEPAVHYYGLWGVIPGETIQDLGPPPTEIDESITMAEIQRAEAGGGTFDVALDFNWDILGNALPAGRNRIKIVLVKGVPADSIFQNNCASIVTHPCNNDDGFHGIGNNREPYAVGRFEQLEKIISHEVMEAMTDPDYWGHSGWQTNESFLGLKHAEVCDDCNGAYNDPSLVWTGHSGSNNGDDISGINRVTLDPSYGGMNSVSSDSCALWEPEQYAPIAVTSEVGSNGNLALAYRTPAGEIETLYFTQNDPNLATVSGPFDLGQPMPGVPGEGGVTAQGKPAIVNWEVRAAGAGQYVFVRGSDNALWMNYNGAWQSLGGVFYGDPSVVYWGGANVNAFVLGTDDRLWTYGVSLGVLQGWNQIPAISGNSGGQAPGFPVLFSGPPKAFSKSPSTIDLFAVGEDGELWTIPFASPGGWFTPIGLGTMDASAGLVSHAWGVPHHTPPSITSWGSSQLDILTTAETDVAHLGSNGSGPNNGWYNGYDSVTGALGSNSPSGTPAIVSWGPNRLDAFMIDRSNKLTHAYWDGSWHPAPLNPMATDAVGDPVVISRNSGQIDLFYRTYSGSLTHFFRNGRTWLSQTGLVPNGSIQ